MARTAKVKRHCSQSQTVALVGCAIPRQTLSGQSRWLLLRHLVQAVSHTIRRNDTLQVRMQSQRKRSLRRHRKSRGMIWTGLCLPDTLRAHRLTDRQYHRTMPQLALVPILYSRHSSCSRQHHSMPNRNSNSSNNRNNNNSNSINSNINNNNNNNNSSSNSNSNILTNSNSKCSRIKSNLREASKAAIPEPRPSFTHNPHTPSSCSHRDHADQLPRRRRRHLCSCSKQGCRAHQWVAILRERGQQQTLELCRSGLRLLLCRHPMCPVRRCLLLHRVLQRMQCGGELDLDLVSLPDGEAQRRPVSYLACAPLETFLCIVLCCQ
mmetsp:Transcript_55333/g.147730  ORF Transcript_55333/g.147730 Transcript_55333/m.147730 type:complete len:322 (-) Transcript_55333:223-1188(-)